MAAGCNTAEDLNIKIVDEFLVEFSVTGEYIGYEPLPLCPERILIIDSLLILKNGNMCNDVFFYVYNKINGDYLSSFGNRGRGPNEYFAVQESGQYIIKYNESISLWIRGDRNRLELLNITSSLKNNDIVIDEKIPVIGQYIFHPSDLFVLTYGNLIGKALSEKGRLFHFDMEANHFSRVDYFPEVNILPFDSEMIPNLYIGPIRIKPDNSKIVSALQLFKQIDVFSVNADHLFSILFNDSPRNPQFYTNPANPIPGDLKHYYYDIYLTDKYIYALNLNIYEDDINKETDTGYSELHVFSWQGHPLACYRLNHVLYSIAVDEEEGWLYGLLIPTGEYIESNVVRFKLYDLIQDEQ